MVLVPRIEQTEVIYQSLQNQRGHLEKLIESLFGGFVRYRNVAGTQSASNRPRRFTRRNDHVALPSILFSACEAGHFVAIVINGEPGFGVHSGSESGA